MIDNKFRVANRENKRSSVIRVKNIPDKAKEKERKRIRERLGEESTNNFAITISKRNNEHSTPFKQFSLPQVMTSSIQITGSQNETNNSGRDSFLRRSNFKSSSIQKTMGAEESSEKRNSIRLNLNLVNGLRKTNFNLNFKGGLLAQGITNHLTNRLKTKTEDEEANKVSDELTREDSQYGDMRARRRTNSGSGRTRPRSGTTACCRSRGRRRGARGRLPRSGS
jgi:hypothetical protein